MVVVVSDGPSRKLGRPGGPHASRILIFVTLHAKMEKKNEMNKVQSGTS
jgi:hypothetical protein